MISKECCRSDTDMVPFCNYLCAIDVFVSNLAYTAEIRRGPGEVRMGSAVQLCNLKLFRRIR
jgi:hypothetical protein